MKNYLFIFGNEITSYLKDMSEQPVQFLFYITSLVLFTFGLIYALSSLSKDLGIGKFKITFRDETDRRKIIFGAVLIGIALILLVFPLIVIPAGPVTPKEDSEIEDTSSEKPSKCAATDLEEKLNMLSQGVNQEGLKNQLYTYFHPNAEVLKANVGASIFMGTIENYLQTLNYRINNNLITVLNCDEKNGKIVILVIQ